MKRNLIVIAFGLASAACSAEPPPAVGLLEILPVTGTDFRVTARPAYILTNQKLSAATIFSGVQDGGARLPVVCCFEVRILEPVALDKVVSRYTTDDNMVEHLKGIKGYTYIYAAEPTADKRRWTSTMKLLATNAADPTDSSPFSSAAVGAPISGEDVPATFKVDGGAVTVSTKFDKKTSRMIYTFTRDKEKIVVSEPTFPD